MRAMCDRCGILADSILGTTHRRCSGAILRNPVAKHAPRASKVNRGTWQQESTAKQALTKRDDVKEANAAWEFRKANARFPSSDELAAKLRGL